MNYTLNIGEWNSVFAVPSSIVDKYIKLANGNALKLILFLLRHGGETYSADRLRTELNFSETGELEDATFFWIQRGVIRLSSDNEGWFSAAKEVPHSPTSTEINDQNSKPESSETETPQRTEVLPIPKPVQKITPVTVSSGEIASRIRQDPKISALYVEAEKLYGKPLNQRDNQTIIALVDHYGLPVEVALMLLQYCSKINKLTPSYIQSVANEWAGNGIDTIETADSRIRLLEKQNGAEERIRETLEMTTALTPAHKKYLAVWLNEWHLSEDLILLAINKTIEQIGKPKFNYTNKILENWKNDGITTVAQAEMPVKNTSSSTSTSSSSSFDMDDVMAMIKSRYNEG